MARPKNSLVGSDRLRLAVCAVVILWVIAQVVHAAVYWGEPQYGDAMIYQRLAHECYDAGSWYPMAQQLYAEPYLFNPGYVNLLILCLHVVGSLTYMPLVNLALNIALLCICMHVVGALCNRKVAMWFAILYCILSSNVTIVSPTLSELWFSVCLYGSIALVCKRWPVLILSGMLMVYANYIRPISALFMLPILLYVIYQRYSWRYYAAYFAGMVVMVAGIVGFNDRINGNPVMSASTMGVNLIMGANDHATGTVTDVFGPGQPGYIENAETLTVFEKDSIWKARALEWISENPGKYLGSMPIKLARLWWADSYTDLPLKGTSMSDTSAVSSGDVVRHALHVGVWSIGYWLVWTLALIGLFRLRRQLFGYWGIFFIPVILASLMHMVMYGGMRYHYPYMPVLLMYAAIGIVMLRNRRLDAIH